MVSPPWNMSMFRRFEYVCLTIPTHLVLDDDGEGSQSGRAQQNWRVLVVGLKNTTGAICIYI